MQYSIYFRRVHFLSTVWFLLCIGTIAAQSLRQAGLEWWQIISISSYSVVTVLFFVSVYLFAVFRGVHRHNEPDIEHPITCQKVYKILYSFTPFLGFVVGICSQMGLDGKFSLTSWIVVGAMGTFMITIANWVILDPTVAILEGYFPNAHKSRASRLEFQRIERERILQKRQAMLKEMAEKEREEQRQQRTELEGAAEKLSDLILSGLTGTKGATHPEVVDLGVLAWQKGGVKCMKMLRDLAWDKCREKGIASGIIDEVDYWWDGIGDWRAKSL